MVANTAISKVLAPVVDRLSPAAAKRLLAIEFSRSEKSRMRQLADKSNEGTLSAQERLELEDWCVAGDLLALLQAEARIALKPVPRRKSKHVRHA
jgi:hypothetical protein